MLECHLDWIARRFQVVSLDDLRVRLETRSRTAPPIAAITFDDGYRDVYEHAFPLLQRKGLPATVFVATSYVGTDGVLPHDKLYCCSSARRIAGVRSRSEWCDCSCDSTFRSPLRRWSRPQVRRRRH